MGWGGVDEVFEGVVKVLLCAAALTSTETSGTLVASPLCQKWVRFGFPFHAFIVLSLFLHVNLFIADGAVITINYGEL